MISKVIDIPRKKNKRGGGGGNSLVVQGLRFSAFTARAQIQSLVEELRSQKPHCMVRIITIIMIIIIKAINITTTPNPTSLNTVITPCCSPQWCRQDTACPKHHFFSLQHLSFSSFKLQKQDTSQISMSPLLSPLWAGLSLNVIPQQDSKDSTCQPLFSWSSVIQLSCRAQQTLFF